ncbi:MAG: hypothetical protein OEM45_04725, partial [Gammaproteobacteria bacterium]|nr:hypothetical protein [Gammaproteobacteria bacterium]
MNEAPTESLLRRTFRRSRDALTQRTVDEPELTARVLVTLNAFRLLICLALLVLFFAGDDPRFFGDRYPTLFAATAAGYLLFAVLTAVLLRLGRAPHGVIGIMQMLVDIVAVVVLMHA